MATPRGIRNNNPGNIERNQIHWDGLAEDQSSDTRFAVFDEPQYGIRAMAKILVNYQRLHGLTTIREIIDRWAPPVENETDAYIEHVASDLGITPNDEINLAEDRELLELLVAAIIEHENGQQPYEEAMIGLGVTLALV